MLCLATTGLVHLEILRTSELVVSRRNQDVSGLSLNVLSGTGIGNLQYSNEYNFPKKLDQVNGAKKKSAGQEYTVHFILPSIAIKTDFHKLQVLAS